MKKLFYDLETLGTDYRKHSIHQLSCLAEIGGEVVEESTWNLRPHPRSHFDESAMRITNVTKKIVLGYPEMVSQKEDFCRMLDKYVNKFKKGDCFTLVGFRNTSFDDFFLRKLFELSGDSYFNSYFFSNSLDASVLATQYLGERRLSMPSFKLHRVATELGIEVDKEKLHDAYYDVVLTREVYRISTGIVVEI